MTGVREQARNIRVDDARKRLHKTKLYKISKMTLNSNLFKLV